MAHIGANRSTNGNAFLHLDSMPSVGATTAEPNDSQSKLQSQRKRNK
jgi:hypothetical protein